MPLAKPVGMEAVEGASLMEQTHTGVWKTNSLLNPWAKYFFICHFLAHVFFFAWIFYVCPSLTPLFVFYSIYLILSTVFFLSLFLLVFCFLLTLSSWHWLGYRVTLICEKSFRQSWNIKFKSYSTTSLLFLSRSLSLSRFPSRFSVSFLAFSLFALHFSSWNKLQPRIIHTGWVY